MQVTITALKENPDGWRSLREWLVDEEELRGRVQLMEPAPSEGLLGPVTEGLLVALAPGGAATVLASVLITWIRHRSHEATYEVTKPDGTSLKVSAKRLRDEDAATLQKTITELSRHLTDAGRISERITIEPCTPAEEASS